MKPCEGARLAWATAGALLIAAVITEAAPQSSADSASRSRAMQQQVARSLLEAGRFAEAEQVLRWLVTTAPSDVEASYALGTLLYRQGYYTAAEPLLSTVVAAVPGDRHARALRAVARMKGTKLTAGEAEARALLREQPPLEDLDLTLTLAEVLYERGDLVGALALVNQAIGFARAHPIPHYWLARILLRQEKLDAAAAAGEASVRLAPQLPYAHDVLSRIYRLQGRTVDAKREAAWLRQFDAQKALGTRR